jgi:coenzyme F420 hydrogenase subunit beta
MLLRPELQRQIGLTIGFFCAGTPTLNATFRLLKELGVDDRSTLISLRYRGNGWPGRATAVWRDSSGAVREASMSYDESWGRILAQDRQFRCNLCLDHTGEFADVAVGDPWHDPPRGDEPGRSLIIARSKRGREIVEQAIEAGFIAGRRVPSNRIGAAQPNLFAVRGKVWGRLLALRMARIPTPRFKGLPAAGIWWRALSAREKFSSVVGVLLRIGRRRLRHRRPVTPLKD